MRTSTRISLGLSVLLLVCCRPSGLINDADVKLVRPEKQSEIQAELFFPADTSAVVQFIDLQIVSDTVLVVRVQPGVGDDRMFRAYSTRSGVFLGAFLHEGRGPGEMLNPHMAKTHSGFDCLCVNENATGQAFLINVLESISDQQTSYAGRFCLPDQTLDWLPLPGMEQFCLSIKSGVVNYLTTSSEGAVRLAVNPFKNSGEQYVTQLSGLFTCNEATGVIIECLQFFPQIVFFDTHTGELRSIAVSRDYQKWESLLDGWTSAEAVMKSIQYYAGVCSSSEYIFATYAGISLTEMQQSGHGVQIHVFGWSGEFVCSLRVSEDLGMLTYDERNQQLYGLDRIRGKIFRYDLSDLLP